MYANFLLGALSISPKAREALKRLPLDLIARHAVNDYGSISPRIVVANLKGMRECGQIMSRYAVDPGDPRRGNVLVITSPSWDATSVQLESE